MMYLMLAINFLNPVMTCFFIKHKRLRLIIQILILLSSILIDSYLSINQQIQIVRDAGGYWPWGNARVTDEMLMLVVPKSNDEFTFFDHIGYVHYLIALAAGIFFFSYNHFFSRLYDYYCRKKISLSSLHN